MLCVIALIAFNFYRCMQCLAIKYVQIHLCTILKIGYFIVKAMKLDPSKYSHHNCMQAFNDFIVEHKEQVETVE